MEDTTATAPENAPRRRVKYGSAPNQTIPFEWAEDILTQMAQHEPKRLAAYISHAAGLLELPSNGTRRRGSVQ